MGQNRFNSLFGQVVNFDDLERLFFFVGSWVIMVDPEIAQFMVKNQKLIQLNISQVPVVLLDFIGPAVIFVLVADGVDLLVVIRGGFNLMSLTLIDVLYVETGALFALLNLEFVTSSFVAILECSNASQVIFIVKA